MRVIAGEARSLPLKTVRSMDVRPTTDKIKETLFNILMPYVNGSRFLDLYAGSGAIGIEAISRGAMRCVFADNSREAQKCIEENLAFTRFTDRAELMKCDADAAIARLDGRETFDIVFMDPPYDKLLEKTTLTALVNSRVLAEDAIVVVEASRSTDFNYVEELGFSVIKDKLYKTNRHLFLRWG